MADQHSSIKLQTTEDAGPILCIASVLKDTRKGCKYVHQEW